MKLCEELHSSIHKAFNLVDQLKFNKIEMNGRVDEVLHIMVGGRVQQVFSFTSQFGGDSVLI